jgi:hypothetical protein
MGFVMRNSDAPIYGHATARHPDPDAKVNIFDIEKERLIPASKQLQPLPAHQKAAAGQHVSLIMPSAPMQIESIRWCLRARQTHVHRGDKPRRWRRASDVGLCATVQRRCQWRDSPDVLRYVSDEFAQVVGPNGDVRVDEGDPLHLGSDCPRTFVACH